MVWVSLANAWASCAALRESASAFKVAAEAIRNTLPLSWQSRELFCNTMPKAWSQGTSVRTNAGMVPLTLGSSTTFKPLISEIKRKKSLRSTSLKLTDIGSPEEVEPQTLPLEDNGLLAVAPTVAACCSAARFTAGCGAILAFEFVTGSWSWTAVETAREDAPFPITDL